jgi:hypothetical protein
MANICDNEMYVYTENKENVEHINEFLKEHFNSECTNIGDNEYEAFFDSKWDFPEDLMDEMVKDISDKEHIYIRVLSVEYGCLYCAFHTYEGDDWE